MNRLILRYAVAAAILLPAPGAAQDDSLVRPYPPDVCPPCAEWNTVQAPVHLFGSTYYVGTRGLAALLIASPGGHVLIDGGLPESAPLILDNIRTLGFDPRDVKLILNTHEHFDHAGGIAALQRATGARVAASPAAAAVLRTGRAPADDPQYGLLHDMPPVAEVDVLEDGVVVRVGDLALTPHFTTGHAPGGTTWTWRACETGRCLAFVFADSQTPISADEFRFTGRTALLARMAYSHDVIAGLECDVLITPHPGASSLWPRLERGREGLVDAEACRTYAETARQQLRSRLEREAGR